jgi:effector-binding domain-containing protein
MVETIKYTVIQKIGKIEIRQYPKIVVAYVEDPNTDAFGLLYNFITGANVQKEKVKMTTPVVSQEIAMTSPVFSQTGSMAFVMPANFTLEATPQPTDSRVKIKEIPSRKVAVLRFSGSWSENHFEKETKELLDELADAKISTEGSVFSMLYNPPFTPSFMRRNEVAIEITNGD